MKSTVLAFGLGLLALSSASAADLPALYTKAPPLARTGALWSGFTAGANVGYGWTDPDGTLAGGNPGQAAAIAAGVYAPSYGLRGSGVVGGGQLGYNWQVGSWVWGIQTDIQGADNRSSGYYRYPGPAFAPVDDNASSSLKWFGTTRLRLGWTVQPNLLVYGTGGVGYGGINERSSTFGPAANYFGQRSFTRAGYAVGGGTEWMFAPKWSVGLEYLYVDLGHSTLQQVDPANGFINYRFRNDINVARALINYHF